MSRWGCICFPCLRGTQYEDREVVVMDLIGKDLTDVPSNIFLYERTLETLLLTVNKIKDLPLPLFHCEALTTLSVDNNYIEVIPPAIGSLVNLQFLDLSRNCIAYISDNIKSCKKLTVLNLSMNPIGLFPEGITHLILLEKLFMCGTMIDFIPANIGRLAKLKIFEMRDNMVSSLPKAFARLTNLMCLDIGQNDFTEIPEAVGDLHALEYFYVDGNELKEVSSFIGGLESLKHLDATNNDIRMISKHIGALTNVTHLSLSNAKLKVLPATIGHLKKLIILRLDGNLLQSLPRSIGYLKHLEQLHLALNNLEQLPSNIGLLRKLFYLDVSSNCIKEVPVEIGSCVNLRILILQDNLLQTIPAEIGNLVNLAVCNLINNHLQYLPISLLKLQKLKSLWLSHNQVKPLTTLVKEFNNNFTLVLTCYLLPQRGNFADEPSSSNAHRSRKDFNSNSGEVEQSRPRIRFSVDSLLDRQSHLSRIPTPYPRRSRSFPARTESFQQLSVESENDESPIVNFPRDCNRGDEVRVAVVKKKAPLQVSEDSDISHSFVGTAHPPPYHIAAKKSKHFLLFGQTEGKEEQGDFEAISIIDEAFRKSLPLSSSSISSQSGQSEVANTDVFSSCNENLLERSMQTSEQDESVSTCSSIDPQEIDDTVSENNFEYQSERQMGITAELRSNSGLNVSKNECDYNEKTQGSFQCKSQVHQFPQSELSGSEERFTSGTVTHLSLGIKMKDDDTSSENSNNVRGRFTVTYLDNNISDIERSTERNNNFNNPGKNQTYTDDKISTAKIVKEIVDSGNVDRNDVFLDNWDFSISDNCTELPNALEDIVSQTEPPTTSLDFFPHRVSSLRVMFEKGISPPEKTRTPWVFGAHKNATVVEVVITKTNFELGFQLESHQTGFFVADVNPGSPASTVLSQGDKILQVEGVNLTNTMKLEELVSILEDFTRPFTVMISRI